MTILLVGVSVAVALLVGRFLYPLMFQDREDFWDCVRFSLTPNLVSMFRGQYLEDVVKSLKLGAFASASGLAGYLTYFGLSSLIR